MGFLLLVLIGIGVVYADSTSSEESGYPREEIGDLYPRLKKSITTRPRATADDWPAPSPEFNNSVDPTKYPSIVDVLVRSLPRYLDKGDTFHRIGVIISAKYVLTLQVKCDECNYTVLVGSDGQGGGDIRYETKLIIPLEKNATSFKPIPKEELALLEVLTPIEFRARAQPANLPDTGVRVLGKVVTVVGTSVSRSLNSTNSKYLECNRTVTGLKYTEYFSWDERDLYEIPASSIVESTCDPGPNSAIFMGDRIVGICYARTLRPQLSHGHPYFIWSQRNHDVASYRDWIKNVTGV